MDDVTNERALEEITRAVKQEPGGGQLATLAIETNPAYDRFLDDISARWNIPDFGPWDLRYVRHQIDHLVDQTFSQAFPIAESVRHVHESLKTLGFDDLNQTLHIFKNREPSIGDYQRGRGMYLYLTHDPAKRETGTTEHFAALSIVTSRVNLTGDGLHAYRVLFHEVGHAVHFFSVKTKYLTLIEKLPIAITEGAARLFERILMESTWLISHTPLSADQVSMLQKWRAMQELLSFREDLYLALLSLTRPTTVDELTQIQNVLAKSLLFPRVDEKDVAGADDAIRAHAARQWTPVDRILASSVCETLLAKITLCGQRTAYANWCYPSLIGFLQSPSPSDEMFKPETGDVMQPDFIGLTFLRRIEEPGS